MTLLGWDADAYDRLALPHERWGLDVIDRLGLAGDETVLDFGCGTGRDVERLLDLLPRGRVVAVDGSAAMLSQVRARLGDRLDGVDIIQADLRDPLPVGPVDAVMSVATLHWLADHRRAFGNIAAALRAGGAFAAEAGGFGNVSSFLRAVAAAGGRPIAGTRNFANVDDTVDRLDRCGYRDIEVNLVRDPLWLDPDVFESFLATIMLVPELAEMAGDQRRDFVRSVARHMGEPVMEYVRLQITAVRS